jgi:CheY-like chemotaxis protein
VEQFRRYGYSVIFMDCQMPEVDGYTAAREIRRLEGKDCRPLIVAMTADAMAGTREQCLAAGMDDYVSKPVRFEALEELLRKWMAHPAAQAQ